jgi:1-acyl-sn-glycerol-3-phosphate acyltransferase
MLFEFPLQISRGMLATAGTHISVQHRERIPATGAMLVISNHRSLLDAPLLMTALDRSVRFACHHYMSQVPILSEMVKALGCFPLAGSGQRQQVFFRTAMELLQAQQPVGIFPEGAEPMVNITQADEMSRFHRGFAHLALRAPVSKLAILPVAVSAIRETVNPVAPLKVFSWFDPSEPLFEQPGWHPGVHYHRVNLTIGHPLQNHTYFGGQMTPCFGR